MIFSKCACVTSRLRNIETRRPDRIDQCDRGIQRLAGALDRGDIAGLGAVIARSMLSASMNFWFSPQPPSFSS